MGIAVGAATHPCADAPTRTSLSAAATPMARHVFGLFEPVASFDFQPSRMEALGKRRHRGFLIEATTPPLPEDVGS